MPQLDDATVLRRAAEIQEEHGTCTGRWYSREGQVCAEGALALAVLEAEGVDFERLVDQVLLKEGELRGSPARHMVANEQLIKVTADDDNYRRIASQVSETVDGMNLSAWNDRVAEETPHPDQTVANVFRKTAKRVAQQ